MDALAQQGLPNNEFSLARLSVRVLAWHPKVKSVFHLFDCDAIKVHRFEMVKEFNPCDHVASFEFV